MAKLTGTTKSVNGMSFYRMSDAPPNWAQNDPSQPDYIANRDRAELSVLVNGEEFTQHAEGVVEPLQFRSGSNVELKRVVEDNNGIKVNTIVIDAKVPEAGLTGIQVNDKALEGKSIDLRAGKGVILTSEVADGENIIHIDTEAIDVGLTGVQVNDQELGGKKLDFRAGTGVELSSRVENGENIITISAGVIDPTESTYAPGEGIELIKTDDKYAISLKDGGITADKIDSVSVTSLVQVPGQILILHGGNANG